MDIHSATDHMQRHKTESRRFKDEQLVTLEEIFHSESRPESQRKQQIADHLGLQPRQVAIWFQNKRARCKTKQIEHDYSVLKASYDNLSARLESLRKVNQSLAAELQRLKNLGKRTKQSRKDEFNSNHLNSNEETQFATNVPLAAQEDSHHELFSEDEAKGTHQYLEQYSDIINIFSVEQQTYGSLTPSENYGSIDSAQCLVGQNFSNEWWESLG